MKDSYLYLGRPRGYAVGDGNPVSDGRLNREGSADGIVPKNAHDGGSGEGLKEHQYLKTQEGRYAERAENDR